MVADLLPHAVIYNDTHLATMFNGISGRHHPDLVIDVRDGSPGSKPLLIDFATAGLPAKVPGPFGATDADAIVVEE